jgi:hypothetical protein
VFKDIWCQVHIATDGDLALATAAELTSVRSCATLADAQVQLDDRRLLVGQRQERRNRAYLPPRGFESPLFRPIDDRYSVSPTEGSEYGSGPCSNAQPRSIVILLH